MAGGVVTASATAEVFCFVAEVAKDFISFLQSEILAICSSDL